MIFKTATVLKTILLFSTIKIILATKCGEYECYENTECTLDESQKMHCLCLENYTKTIDDNKIHCCREEGNKCGPKHQCNKLLQCVENSEEQENILRQQLECEHEQQKCSNNCCSPEEICSNDGICVFKGVNDDQHFNECHIAKRCTNKCCKENEICFENKECKDLEYIATECPLQQQCAENCCLTNEICSENENCVAKAEECPKSLQCWDKCCTSHEFCSEQGICKPKECPLDEQCGDICCNKSEICSEHKECIPKNNNTSPCPLTQQCSDKCCEEREICSEDKQQCITPEAANALKPKCVIEKQCNGKCCADNEFCSGLKECIANEFQCPSTKNCSAKCCASYEICDENQNCVAMLSACPAEQQCNAMCCNDNEFCSENKECVYYETISLECPKKQLCGDKCCSQNEICFENVKCRPIIAECPDHLQCAENCCKETELCTATNECIVPIEQQTMECPLVQKCQDQCCSVYETCLNDECVAIEIILQECPVNQICLDKCCSDHEICSIQNECVNENVLAVTNLYDLPNEKFLKRKNRINHMDAVVELYDFENTNNALQCPLDGQPCQGVCCGSQQFCNELLQCVEKSEDINSNGLTPLNYIIIGLGCIVTVFGFSLFKIYGCMRSNNFVF